MKKIKEISVFFPAYNEADNIGLVVKKALAVLDGVANKFEIIVVDDGSKDDTKKLVTEIIKSEKQVKLISHQKNQGYGGAIKTGLYQSGFNLIAFNDGDGQFDFSEIENFIPKLDKADLVIGYRKKRSDPFFRLVNAKLYSLFLRILFGLNVKDVDCAFKVVKKKVIDEIPELVSNGALISAELLIRSKKAGFVIAQVPVNHYPRLSGSPTGAKLGVIFRMFREVMGLYKTLK